MHTTPMRPCIHPTPPMRMGIHHWQILEWCDGCGYVRVDVHMHVCVRK